MVKNVFIAGLFLMVGCGSLIANDWNPIVDVSGLACVQERPGTLNSEPSILANVSEPETPTVQEAEPTPAFEEVWVTEYQQTCIGGQCFQQPVRKLVRRPLQAAAAVVNRSVGIVQTAAAVPMYAVENIVSTVAYRTETFMENRQFRPLQRMRNRMAAFHQRRAMRLLR